MQIKNSQLFTMLKNESITGIIYKLRFFIVLAIALLLLLSSCKKNSVIAQSLAEQYFEQNILTKTFIVQLATDSSKDITAQFSDYNFVLTKTTALNGPLSASNGTVTVTGTWSSNSDYSQLVISLPNTPTDFTFLSRAWKFTSKALPVLQLAPWGTTDPKVLYMQRL